MVFEGHCVYNLCPLSSLLPYIAMANLQESELPRPFRLAETKPRRWNVNFSKLCSHIFLPMDFCESDNMAYCGPWTGFWSICTNLGATWTSLVFLLDSISMRFSTVWLLEMTRYCTLVWIDSCFCTLLVDFRSNSICPASFLFNHSKTRYKACQELVNYELG